MESEGHNVQTQLLVVNFSFVLWEIMSSDLVSFLLMHSSCTYVPCSDSNFR